MTDEAIPEKVLSLQVSVQIIKHISSGLYRSPASALKELLSNSYDADATTTEVEFHFFYDEEGKPSLHKISVKDNGSGMDLRDLTYAFTHIGGSRKEVEEHKTPILKRDVIGRLGIGMLSVASACRSFVVKTKKKNEEREYRAEVSLSFFEDLVELKETMDKFSIGNVKISSTEKTGVESYTEVEISDFRPPFLINILDNVLNSYFYYKNIRGTTTEDLEKYFINFIEIMGEEGKLGKLPVFDQVITQLSLMAPVEYLSDGPIRPVVKDKDNREREIPGARDPVILSIKKDIQESNFSVYCKVIKEAENGVLKENRFKLFKPIRYPLEYDLNKKSIDDLDPYVFVFDPTGFKFKNEAGEETEAKIRGYAYHQYARILPHEFRGLLLRVYGVAIGENFRDELRLYSEDPVVLHQLEVEVYLDRGFQSIVNLDRESLFEGARSYVFLRSYLDNLFKGKPPEMPEAVTREIVVDAKESQKGEPQVAIPSEGKYKLTKTDDAFYKSLSTVLTEKDGLVSKIKGKREKTRAKVIEERSPVRLVKEEIRARHGVEEVEFNYTLDVGQFGETTQEGKIFYISLPKTKGPKSKLWDGIFATAAVWGSEREEQKKELMRLLYEIYNFTENK